MSRNVPRVSIGLPVNNGENYIRDAIDSIFSQSFSNLEVIISDNASTDRTGDICRDAAARGTRGCAIAVLTRTVDWPGTSTAPLN